MVTEQEDAVQSAAAKLDRESLLELVGVQSRLINALKEENARLAPQIDELNQKLARRRRRTPRESNGGV